MTNRSLKTSLPHRVTEDHAEEQFRHGLALFNSALFFEAHEVLEEVWRAASHHSPMRRHLQGLVQLAVAFHHQSTGNCIGARSVMKRGARNLEGAEASFPDMELASLRASVEDWKRYLEQVGNTQSGLGAHTSILGNPPALPQITLRE